MQVTVITFKLLLKLRKGQKCKIFGKAKEKKCILKFIFLEFGYYLNAIIIKKQILCKVLFN